MEESKKDGVSTEFNMSIASLQRVHLLFTYINQASLNPNISIGPAEKYQAYQSVYEEVNCIMSEPERVKCEDLMTKLTTSYDGFIKYQNRNTNGNPPQQRFVFNKRLTYGTNLNTLLTRFGIVLRQILQKHGYLYKKSEDMGRAVFR